jgi:signal transduction histidine kinase
MKWPLRNQIFVPFAVLLAASVILVALVSVWTAADQIRQQQQDHLQAATAALSDASFPLTRDVIQRIGAMIGGEVIVTDRQGQISATTLALQKLPETLNELARSEATTSSSLRVNATDYYVTMIPRLRVPRPGPLFILIPQQDLKVLQRNVILPPLLVAVFTAVLALVMAMLIARRLSQRVDQLKFLFGELAAGRFPMVAIGGQTDELQDLTQSANDLSSRLQLLQRELQRTERLQLLGQLSGGLAHQLRNSVTGARLALELHQQECPGDNHGLLSAAFSQLRLTEEQVMAVLSLRNHTDTLSEENIQQTGSSGHAGNAGELPVETDIVAMIDELLILLRPQCLHWKTQISVNVAPDCRRNFAVRSPSSLKGALLNLVLNAVQAAGTGGFVEIRVLSRSADLIMEIRDNGPGFQQDAETLTDAFQTTKPQGIGLGLTIARHAVQREGGRMTIARDGHYTSVRISIPQSVIPESTEPTE